MAEISAPPGVTSRQSKWMLFGSSANKRPEQGLATPPQTPSMEEPDYLQIHNAPGVEHTEGTQIIGAVKTWMKFSGDKQPLSERFWHAVTQGFHKKKPEDEESFKHFMTVHSIDSRMSGHYTANKEKRAVRKEILKDHSIYTPWVAGESRPPLDKEIDPWDSEKHMSVILSYGPTLEVAEGCKPLVIFRLPDSPTHKPIYRVAVVEEVYEGSALIKWVDTKGAEIKTYVNGRQRFTNVAIDEGKEEGELSSVRTTGNDLAMRECYIVGPQNIYTPEEVDLMRKGDYPIRIGPVDL